MAELTTLARPYAKAVFALALETDQVSEWSDQLTVLGNVLSSTMVQDYLDRPEHTAEQRATWIQELVGDQLGDGAKNLVRLLSKNDRLDILPALAERYDQLRADAENSLEVELASSQPVSDDFANKLTSILKSRFGKDIRLNRVINPELKGGAVITAGDTVIDGSVHGRLQRLAQELTH
ncbi:MAG: F0F1 ATP synthase subunit delta [Gammaproteobacteria bacterium]|nr:F0F1 ATP synthase subunit delta [Gammaproteobacteria bacterium]